MHIVISFGTTIASVCGSLFCEMSRGTIMDNLSVSSLDETIRDADQERYMFRVGGYIPHRYGFKYVCCAASSVAMALGMVIIVALMAGEESGPTFESAKMTSTFGGKLVLLTNDTKILTLDPTTNDLNLISEEPKESVTAFDIHIDGRIYWSEINNSRLVTLAPNKTLSILLEDARLKPKGLVLDRVAENLYVIDEAAGTLVILNVRSEQYGLLISDLSKPFDIVLDSEEGLIFILQLSNSIVRANMDGTGLTPIVTNIGITAFTLDTSRKRLYWINDFVNIESSNYDGSNRQSFFTDSVTIATLTVLDERIYWLWPSHGHVTSLLSCEIGRNDTCNDYKVHDIEDLSNAESIRGYSRSERSIKNPCKIKNGGCQQLCLISGKNRRSCACRIGWQLNPDRRSCREAHEFVLYPYGDVIRASSLDGSKDLIWPTRYTVESLKVKREIDFDYDLRNDDFYFSDDFHIYTMKLRSASDQTVIVNSSATDMVIQDVAFDWLTGNIYFVQRNTNGTKDHSIVLINMRLGEAYRKTIMTARHRSLFGIQRCPYSLVLHPTQGSILYACDLEGPPNIHQLTMNGTSVFRYEHPFLPMNYGRILSVDFFDNSIFWISFSVDMTFIEHTQFYHSYSKSLTVDNVRRAGTIDVFQQWLYVANSTSIWRANKETGKDVVKIVPRLDDKSKTIAGMKIFSEAVQFSGGSNPCVEDNGGCEQFCFAGEKATCGCKDGQTVGSDGRCT